MPGEPARVAGCVSQCYGGCTFPGIVYGDRLDTGASIIPSGDTGGGSGYSCGASVPAGTEVLLEAVANEGFRFVEWLSVGNWQPCPCALSGDPVCRFVVNVDGIYCGAALTRQDGP
jgi:hypothetical protein